MATQLGEDTKITLDLKTIAIVIAGAVSLATMYLTLKKDIEIAKELPKPTISRTEYDLKDQLIRETIMNTQEKVEENSSKLDKIKNKVASVFIFSYFQLSHIVFHQFYLACYCFLQPFLASSLLFRE